MHYVTNKRRPEFKAAVGEGHTINGSMIRWALSAFEVSGRAFTVPTRGLRCHPGLERYYNGENDRSTTSWPPCTSPSLPPVACGDGINRRLRINFHRACADTGVSTPSPIRRAQLDSFSPLRTYRRPYYAPFHFGGHADLVLPTGARHTLRPGCNISHAGSYK